MDERTFDGVAEKLAAGRSRRRVLKGVAGGALAGVFGLRSVSRAGAQVLPPDTTTPLIDIDNTDTNNNTVTVNDGGGRRRRRRRNRRDRNN